MGIKKIVMLTFLSCVVTPFSQVDKTTTLIDTIPIIFGKHGDGFQDSVEVAGVIKEVTIPPGCGVIYWAGTMRIETTGNNQLFLVVPCLFGKKEDFLNKKVRFSASKLNEKEKRFELISNGINSNGDPFYVLIGKLSMDPKGK